MYVRGFAILLVLSGAVAPSAAPAGQWQASPYRIVPCDGAWPENRAPAVLTLAIVWYPDPAKVYLRPEVVIPKDSYAGGGEKPAVPLTGLIPEDAGPRIHFTAPAEEGAYRLFVQVRDGKRHVGYANAAFYVRQE